MRSPFSTFLWKTFHSDVLERESSVGCGEAGKNSDYTEERQENKIYKMEYVRMKKGGEKSKKYPKRIICGCKEREHGGSGRGIEVVRGVLVVKGCAVGEGRADGEGGCLW